MTAYEIISDDMISINGIEIAIAGPVNRQYFETQGDVIFMDKGMGQIDAYVELAAMAARRGKAIRDVVEVGVFRGGAAVFLHQLFDEPALCCIEFNPKPIPLLEQYRATPPNLTTHYGTNQADREAVLRAVKADCPDGLDLLIDDASHFYEESRATFEVLFPLLRPGGIYVFEDWGWPHVPLSQLPGHFWAHKLAPTNLMFELIVAFAARTDAFAEVHCVIGFGYVIRGAAPLPTDGSFRLDDYLLTRGRKIGLI